MGGESAFKIRHVDIGLPSEWATSTTKTFNKTPKGFFCQLSKTQKDKNYSKKKKKKMAYLTSWPHTDASEFKNVIPTVHKKIRCLKTQNKWDSNGHGHPVILVLALYNPPLGSNRTNSHFLLVRVSYLRLLLYRHALLHQACKLCSPDQSIIYLLLLHDTFYFWEQHILQLSITDEVMKSWYTKKKS